MMFLTLCLDTKSHLAPGIPSPSVLQYRQFSFKCEPRRSLYRGGLLQPSHPYESRSLQYFPTLYL